MNNNLIKKLIGTVGFVGLATLISFPSVAQTRRVEDFFNGIPDNRNEVTGPLNQSTKNAIAINTPSEAVQAVLDLPQVRQKAAEVESISDGNTRLTALIKGYPTSTEPYYTVQVVEERTEQLNPIYSFRVFTEGGAIAVQNVRSGNYISLKDWEQIQ